MFERILVAFDGTPESRRAYRAALELALRFHSSLTIAIVHPPSRTPDGSELQRLVPIDSEGKTIAMLLEEMEADARSRGITSMSPVYLQGEVTPALVDYLKRVPHDLAVVGSRGLSRGRRLLLGSVSSGLATDAPCAVLVVRTSRTGRAGEP